MELIEPTDRHIPVRVSPHERDFFVFVNNMFYIKTSDL